MGMGGISIWQLLIILVIVLLLFGTKRLKGIGADLGNAIKGFRSAMTDDSDKAAEAEPRRIEDAAVRRDTDTGTVAAKPADAARAPDKDKV